MFEKNFGKTSMHWYSFLMHCTAYIINYICHDVCMLKIASQMKLVPTFTRNSWQSYLNNSISLQKLCNSHQLAVSVQKKKDSTHSHDNR